MSKEPINSSRGRKPSRGFTLIELLIVVAIVGILAMVAYPAYVDQVRKARRADAKAVVMELAQALERYYSENNRYDKTDDTGDLTLGSGAGNIFPDKSPLDGSERYYTLTVTMNATTYDITAVPKGAQVGDRCGSLTLDETGDRDVSGADAGVTKDDCW